MNLRRLILAFTLLTGGLTYAQNVNHFGVFPVIDHSGQLSDKWNYSLYYFGAFNLISDKVNNKSDNAGFFIFYSEEALTYSLNKNLSFTGAYVYERQHPLDQDTYRNENRFYLQTTVKSNIGRAQLRNRLRYDGRFIQNRETNQTPYTSRLRYLLGITIPLGRGKFYFNAYNEMFFNTYSNPVAVYAENWAYAGIGLNTKRAGAFELGPFYMFWVTNAQKDLLNFYYLQLSWITKLDLRKNKN